MTSAVLSAAEQSKELAQQGRQIEKAVETAAERLRAGHDDVDAFANAAAAMARLIRKSVEQQAQMVAALTTENDQLKRALDRLAASALVQTDEVDTRWFGAHLRQTWRELTGR